MRRSTCLSPSRPPTPSPPLLWTIYVPTPHSSFPIPHSPLPIPHPPLLRLFSMHLPSSFPIQLLSQCVRWRRLWRHLWRCTLKTEGGGRAVIAPPPTSLTAIVSDSTERRCHRLCPPLSLALFYFVLFRLHLLRLFPIGTRPCDLRVHRSR